jgi:hypothetical protein
VRHEESWSERTRTALSVVVMTDPNAGTVGVYSVICVNRTRGGIRVYGRELPRAEALTLASRVLHEVRWAVDFQLQARYNGNMNDTERLKAMEAALTFIAQARPDETKDELIEEARRCLEATGKALVHGFCNASDMTWCGLDGYDSDPSVPSGWADEQLKIVTCPNCRERLLVEES